MISSKNIFQILFINILFLLSPIAHEITYSGSAEVNTTTPVDCIIVKFSGCPDCVVKYNNHVEPFYQKYKDNNSIDFRFIDAYPDFDNFYNEMATLNITVADYGNLPWVIFLWGSNQKVVLDAEAITANPNQVYITFESILIDIGYTPPDNNEPSIPTFDIVDISLLLQAVILILGITLVTVLGLLIENKFTEFEFKPIRIENKRLLVFTVLTVFSLITLTYQFLDYLQGGCGCTSNNVTKTLLFRKYEVFSIFGLKLPFSLLGIITMVLVLIQMVILGFISIPMEIPLIKDRSFRITNRLGEFWYYFLAFQLFFINITLFYLLYLELFVIEFICIFCTFSQLIIVINTILFVTWSPFPKTEKKGN